jgi:hypothetical protein
MQSLAGGAVGSAGNLLAASAGGIVGKVLSSIPGVSGMTGGLLGMIGGNVIQSGAEAAFSVKQNPYMEMMFSGVGFRKFQFEFIMRPRDGDEVEEVAEILNKFRTFTKPTYTEGSLGKSFMDYPMEFQIEFLTSGQRTMPNSDDSQATRQGGMSFMTNPHVPKLKNCVCDSVSSNFTPQSIWAAHAGGNPVAVTLGLSFQETELVMAEDVMGDGKENKGGY